MLKLIESLSVDAHDSSATVELEQWVQAGMISKWTMELCKDKNRRDDILSCMLVWMKLAKDPQRRIAV